MPKPTKNAFRNCLILTLVAALGAVVGFLLQLPLLTLAVLLPTVVYEFYRTEGLSTKLASLLVLFLVVVEMIILVSGIVFNITEHLGTFQEYAPLFLIEFGEISIAIPIFIAIISAYLVIRTRGIYTRWLALVIIVISLAVIYTIDPQILLTITGYAIE